MCSILTNIYFRYESALEIYLRLVDEADNDSLSLRTSELSLSDSIRSNDSMPDSLRSFISDQVTEGQATLIHI